MRKIFLDIGAHRGQTLLKAMEELPPFDWYIGVEPIPEMTDKIKALLKDRKETYTIIPLALDKLKDDTRQIKTTFYFDPKNTMGSSLCKDKKMTRQTEIEVTCMDIRHFFRNTFISGDEITLKVDVEGKEYDLFEALLDAHLLPGYVKKIYCEWHWYKVKSLNKEIHNRVLKRLNKLGYNLTGHSSKDEFFKGQ